MESDEVLAVERNKRTFLRNRVLQYFFVRNFAIGLASVVRR